MADMTPSQHVGMRVRMYRMQKKLTLEEFAKRINKSPSTVSKYESGGIVIDVNVLFEMAQALGVTVGQLIDYHISPPAAQPVTGNFFQRADFFYVYTLFSPSKTPYICAMELLRDETADSQGKLVFYFDVESTQDYTNSAYIYNGRFRCFDQGAVFYLDNPYNLTDCGMIYARSPFSAASTTRGIFTFLPTKLRNPSSTKVLFSTAPLELDGRLIQELSIADKETISTLKKSNLLLIN